ncbi:TetR/AcrR family transcriptional regulator [Nocardioides sp. ChNu-99]|uniref:TetR/AcrR family transcriptional regulator n=1 Tax=Nocardioides sp. ChNu-99 TaxID=2839897 RepID=UPI002405F92C|nr:TetR/AcrR family transcriptional regulator [Nocardioides sp. ChNu-99]MDF9717457.1 TetR/AcrR family transcriptional regulator [Nocardioides sp. ChNu-99]
MSPTTSDARAEAPTLRGPAVRARILEAATHRFYADGIRAVSADRLIADAGISKVTFYRHFASKDDLVVAYLERVAAEEEQALTRVRAARSDDPAAVLLWYADHVAEVSCAESFRGCAFLNAAAEIAQEDHPARAVVAAHRAFLLRQARELLAEMGLGDAAAERAAHALLMLRDGAMVASSLDGDPAGTAAALVAAGEAVVRTARG